MKRNFIAIIDRLEQESADTFTALRELDERMKKDPNNLILTRECSRLMGRIQGIELALMYIRTNGE